MTTVYEIAPAPGGWTLAHGSEILAECESEAWALRIAGVMLEQGRRVGRSIQISLVGGHGHISTPDGS